MTLEEAIEEMTTALETLTAEIPELQVYGYWNPNPSPPSIDIYPPPELFQEGAGFGVGEKKVFWYVRARVQTSDPESASRTLLRLLDCNGPASVEGALADVCVVGNDGTVSGFTRWGDDVPNDLMGVYWRMEMYV